MDETNQQNNSGHPVFDGVHFDPQFEVALKNFLKARYKSNSGTIPSMAANTTQTIAHGLGVTPTHITVDGFTSGGLGHFYISSFDATNIVVGYETSGVVSASGQWFASYIAN